MNSLTVLTAVAVFARVTVAIPIDDRVDKCSPTCQAGFVCRSGTCEPLTSCGQSSDCPGSHPKCVSGVCSAAECDELEQGKGCSGSEIHIASGTTALTCRAACAAVSTDGCCEFQNDRKKCMFTEVFVIHADSGRHAAVCRKIGSPLPPPTELPPPSPPTELPPSPPTELPPPAPPITDYSTGKLTKCQRDALEGSKGSYVATCNEDGSYEEVQCNGSIGYCWCVDENGSQVGDAVRGSPNCNVPDAPTWNNAALTIRAGDSSDQFTIAGETWKDGQVYYTNLPDSVQSLFPMYGTQDVNTGDSNTLVLTQIMRAFMLRKSGWRAVPMDGWKHMSTGQYLGSGYGDIELYQRLWNAGTYDVDNNSAMYLFSYVIDGQLAWKHESKSQCYVDEIQYSGDRIDNPIFGAGGFVGVMTLQECQDYCISGVTDSHGRPCVAVEHSSQDPDVAANCAIAWGCDHVRDWSGGDTYYLG